MNKKQITYWTSRVGEIATWVTRDLDVRTVRILRLTGKRIAVSVLNNGWDHNRTYYVDPRYLMN